MEFRNVQKLVCHDDADGIASALVALKLLVAEHTDVVFVQYGKPEREEMEAEPGLLFIDMSPPKERAKEFADVGALVIDHHEPNFKDLDCFPRGQVCLRSGFGVCGATLAAELGVMQWLRRASTIDRAGVAQIVEMARLVGIRDTWERSSLDWSKACELSAELTFWPFNVLLNTPISKWTTFREAGKVLIGKRQRAVEQAIEGAFETSWKGVRICMFQGLHLSSDAAESFEDAMDLVVGFGIWCVGVGEAYHQRVTFSLRSHTGVDCAAIAKKHGGGGHKAAAGFSVPLDGRSPYTAFIEALAWAREN